MRLLNEAFKKDLPDHAFPTLGREVVVEPGEVTADVDAFASQLSSSAEEFGFTFCDLNRGDFKALTRPSEDSAWPRVPEPHVRVCIPHLDFTGDGTVFIAAPGYMRNRSVGVSPLHLVRRVILSHLPFLKEAMKNEIDREEILRLEALLSENMEIPYLPTNRPAGTVVNAIFLLRDNILGRQESAHTLSDAEQKASISFVEGVQKDLTIKDWTAQVQMRARRVLAVSSRVAHYRVGSAKQIRHRALVDLLTADYKNGKRVR